MVRDKKRLEAFAYCWADLLFEVDGDWTITYAAGATDVLLGSDAGTLIGQRLEELVMPVDRPGLEQLKAGLEEWGRVHSSPLSFQGSKGNLVELQVAAHSVMSRGRHFLSCRMLSRKEAERLRRRSTETGLLDPQAFSEVAAEQIKANPANQFTLLDIPAIHQAESRLGSSGYRQLLESLGSKLRLYSTDGDSATQLSGSRFGVLQASAEDASSLREAVSRLLDDAEVPGTDDIAAHSIALDHLEEVSEDDLARTLLYGISRFRDSAEDLSIEVVSKQLDQVLRRSVVDLCRIKAVSRGRGFELAFQPIVDLKTGVIHHFEALCRFEPERSPFELIRFAEETGMAPELDYAVLSRVLEQVAAIPINVDHQPVAVNLSGASITNARFLAEAERLLACHPAARDRILFEITESAKIGDLAVANAAIQQFRNLGFPVCLDDFGAGACSFQYLSGVDVDIVKLDGSAIHNARATARGAAFLSALTQFCTSLGMEVVAEHIETRDLLHFCIDNGCRYGQGFLFGRPAADLAVFRNSPNESRRFPAPH